MPVPFKVKAVYEYRSEEPDDLNFDNGQIITVTEEEDADWYTGEYSNAQGQTIEGIFPRNFVERYEPAIPTRPARGPRKPPQPDPVPEPVQEPEAPSASETVVPAAVPPPVHEPSKEAEVEPPRQFTEPAPAPAPAQRAEPLSPPPTAGESKPTPTKKPPPVVEKPSSFKDRIAAFNKPAAAPVAPFKPPGSGGTGFIKKPFVAPPPSRNAYVPPPRDPPPAKAYRREEEVEHEGAEQEPAAPNRPSVAPETTPTEEDQPKPTSLKDRIALLQQQQLEAAQRQAEIARKKEKPKRPSKPARTESSEAPIGEPEDGPPLERVPTEKSRREPELYEDEPPVRRLTDEYQVAPTPPLPSRELVSDTNDADDSGAADTEDPHDISTEEERPRPKPVMSPPMAAAKPEPAAEEEDDEEETEEEEDPELRRKRELRERMAKMSGGMGMMGMFGAGASAPPKRSKSTKEEKHQELQQEEEEPQRAPPVPIMALPGMSNKSMQQPAPIPAPEEVEDRTAEPTPIGTQGAESVQDDYLSQRPSRKSTDAPQPLSPQNRAPPPLPEDRPEPPQSPGSRPVPPPPPPTRHDTQHSRFQGRDESDEDEPELTSPSSAPKPPSGPPAAPPRALPPPPPVRTDSSDDGPRNAPPVPMSPTSPHSRAPPPPPPGLPPRRTPTQSSVHPPAREESDEEVTEYEGDYDTDIASGAKHKAALKSHQRDSSFDDGALSDDGVKEAVSPQARTVPPPIPTTAPRDVPPPPLQTAPRPRESVESPRAAPPPIPFPQAAPRPRESVESPRAAPPMVPQTQSPIERDDYDPYRYSAGPQSGMPVMVASMRKPTEEFDDDYAEPPRMQQPPERAVPPPPPSERAVPPPPPAAAPGYQESDPMSMSGGLSAPRRSAELGRSNTTSRRSTDVPRPSADHGFIAADVDLAQGSMWWTQENNPPPSLRNRNDVLWEVESSTTQKRGGRASVSRDVYVLYQDYSQTTINATFDASEPSHVAFEQNHERPPNSPRKDQLENAWETFGVQIAKGAEKALGGTIGEGTAQEFVLSLIRPMAAALLPVGTRAYGALVYANLANASTQQFDEIRAGDIMSFKNAKFAGHKGGLHQKYSQDVPQHVAVVIDWDGTKKKIRVWEQGHQEKGRRAKVREESYRVLDLKSGEVRVWRVMPRSYVNWGTA